MAMNWFQFPASDGGPAGGGGGAEAEQLGQHGEGNGAASPNRPPCGWCRVGCPGTPVGRGCPRWPFGHRLGPAPFALQPRGLKAVRTPSARTSGVVGSRTHTRGTPGRPVGRRVPAPGPTDVGGDRLRQLLLCTPTGIVRRCRPVAAEQLKLVWTFSAVLSRRRVVPVGTPAWTAARRPGVVRVGQRVAALVLGPLLRAVRRSLANPGLGPLPVVDVRVGLGLRCDGLGPVPLGYMWAIQGRTI